MRHIFIVNPAAGKTIKREIFEKHVLEAGEKLNKNVEIYETKHSGDGEVFVRETAKANPDEKIRFYACGGDGALNEVVNGAFGFENVEVGCIPMGTGNDYIRNFGTAKQFRNLEAQLKGEAVNSDLIQFISDGNAPRYCINMFNIGFDCNVADQTTKTKKVPFIKGHLAYLISIVIILVKKKIANLRVEYEDGKVFDGPLLLIAIANGCFCGGGVKGLPLARIDEGKMDVQLIRDLPRRQFPGLFLKYSKGTHLQDKRINDLVDYDKCSSLKVTANEEKLRLCTDGEISDAVEVEFKILPAAIKFAVPVGASV